MQITFWTLAFMLAHEHAWKKAKDDVAAVLGSGKEGNRRIDFNSNGIFKALFPHTEMSSMHFTKCKRQTVAFFKYLFWRWILISLIGFIAFTPLFCCKCAPVHIHTHLSSPTHTHTFLGNLLTQFLCLVGNNNDNHYHHHQQQQQQHV